MTEKAKDITPLTVLAPLRDFFLRKKYPVKCGWCGRVGKAGKIPRHEGQIIFTFCKGCKKDGAITYSNPGVMI